MVPSRKSSDQTRQRENQEVQVWERTSDGSTEADKHWRDAEAELQEELAARNIDLDKYFLKLAYRGDDARMVQYIGRVDVNVRDPKTGSTALHYVAAHGGRPALLVLIKSGKCNFLIRDKKGRLASELAGIYGLDPVMARLLLKKEAAQARVQGSQAATSRSKSAVIIYSIFCSIRKILT